MALEPLYTSAVACELIPISHANLANILYEYKHLFPPRYDTLSPGQPRMLSESECLKIRELVIQRKTGRWPQGRRQNTIAPIKTRQAREQILWKAVEPFLVG